MNTDRAECGHLTEFSAQLAQQLDAYLTFQHPDAQQQAHIWRSALEQPIPEDGIGIRAVLAELGNWVIPNGSPIPNPGCTAFITTGATTIGALATLAGSVAAPQRLGLTAFNFLEELSLDWMARMFELPEGMKGLYSSGGSVANLVALGAARQRAFEGLGIDPARDGINRPCRLYASAECHHSVQRAAAVLGMGRRSVCEIETDAQGRMCPAALRRQLMADQETNLLPVAVIANAGSTNRGAIDPLREVGETARAYGVWFHVDGAYGLPGILDPRIRHLYAGLELADSVIVDPHKWLGAPVGIGATYVKDRELLNRAFTQEAATYLEGACTTEGVAHSMDNLGIPYADMGVELSAPSRGAVVWALIREIGVAGLRERIVRHNSLARHVAERAQEHPNLQVVSEPTLSICGFRYLGERWDDLNELNRRIHRRMVQRGLAIPSTTVVNGALAIRPCFVGARTTLKEADELVDEVLIVGQEVAKTNDEAAG
ncbi:pyridoxal phosphate-dependent decarboxylase family protein [Marinobacter sp. F4206]|uniref:pyridoxal phosphate-dependent decarboxylase family protein n=1 Tax=Marinobacter sp. F4206 TaxID=2861777 RepID=UPI001C5EDF32|nr:aminotransferase class V-fold PLP-dependent enzyme [Marinobacter sp. F4206]MBW4936649.1 aminotransferase class V-fold PLP-dependent enzyme [Marinobacter sp. F4206]